MKRHFLKQAGRLGGLLAVVLLAGCEAKTATEQTATSSAATTTAPADSAATPVVTAAYICPMGCEGSASDKPGKCPVCQMDLEPNPAAKPAAQL
ncbi:heavy metal-binding domain-containing protein [Hymenobacter sp. UYP22]|uniref:heavy metal-binding domain-containing protein n=1 Tax=Hymenobacter sp. UYP22 TaxID=3156348 RepID=UPI00339B821F